MIVPATMHVIIGLGLFSSAAFAGYSLTWPCCAALLIRLLMLLIEKMVWRMRLIWQAKGMVPLRFKDGCVCC